MSQLILTQRKGQALSKERALDLTLLQVYCEILLKIVWIGGQSQSALQVEASVDICNTSECSAIEKYGQAHGEWIIE